MDNKTVSLVGFDKELKVQRTSAHSAEVGLLCDEHQHEPFMVGLYEEYVGWGVGRKDTSGPHNEGTFLKAVNHCASMLWQECEAESQMDLFFSEEGVDTINLYEVYGDKEDDED